MSFKNNHKIGDHIPDERELWNSFLKGDLDAWEQIFKFFYEDLYGYGLKLSTRPELTKDCIHELFVVLWERRDYLGDVVSVKAYLLASLRRKLLKKIKKKREYFIDVNTKREDYPDNIRFSPEEVIIKSEIQNEKIEALYNALDSLPDRQKEVLYLKYFNGMSYSEIEEILGINYQSIRNHVYRAIKKLRNIIEEYMPEITISVLPFLISFLFWI